MIIHHNCVKEQFTITDPTGIKLKTSLFVLLTITYEQKEQYAMFFMYLCFSYYIPMTV